MKRDPSLQAGLVQIHQCELSVRVRSESLSFEDQVMVRVFKGPTKYKLALTSQSNISFLYFQTLSHQKLAEMAGKRPEDEASWFRDIFSGEHRYEIIVVSVEEAELVVQQAQKFKNYELARFQLQLGSEQAIRESLMFRYQRMQMRQKMLDAYWDNMCGIIKAKNPSILLQLEQKYKRTAFK